MCLQVCMSPCHHVSVSARQVVSVSVSQCQRTACQHDYLLACQHVKTSACQVVSVLSVSTFRWATVSACQHVSVFNYNVTSDKNSSKNPEDYNCNVATVLNVLHLLWSCTLLSFCASFESSSKLWRGKIISLVVFFKVQVKLQSRNGT